MAKRRRTTILLPIRPGEHWNEASPHPDFDRGIVSIFALDPLSKVHMIGTGFIVSRSDRHATCVTAAHVLNEARRVQAPPQRHAASALFVPPPKPIDLDPERLRAISTEAGRVEACIVKGVALDDEADLAVFSIALQDDKSRSFFAHAYEIDSSTPQVGDLVCILSYRGLKAEQTPVGSNGFQLLIQQGAVLRIGRVLEYHPNGTTIHRGPCIETSIPVFHGMSGGPAFIWSDTGAAKVFGFVCLDRDGDNDKDKDDRGVEGRSIVALLPARSTKTWDGQSSVQLKLKLTAVAGEFDPAKHFAR